MVQISLLGRFKLLCILPIVLVLSLCILLEIDVILKRWTLLLLVVMCVIIALPNEEGKFLKQSLLPIIFLAIACSIPYVHLYDPHPTVPEYPPPGYSTQWLYFLIGDYDYFFRLRFLPNSIPFWIITGFVLLQMKAPPHHRYYVDIIMHIAIGCMLSIIWWFLSMGIVGGIATWVTSPNAFTPIVGIVIVAVQRTIIRPSIESGIQ